MESRSSGAVFSFATFSGISSPAMSEKKSTIFVVSAVSSASAG
jgi:hypothetical protein